ncbi:storkhead-box protein 1 isoform B [Patagioenas fasciata monilis]|nr:storkhead-box protein 1 isoform B [Patagioenas fasciata monilis]
MQKQERALQRPQSLDPSKTIDYKTEQLATETQADKAKQHKVLRAERSSLQPKKDSVGENFSYPQGNTLQIDNKSKFFLESNIAEENIYRSVAKTIPGDIKKSPHSHAEDNGVSEEDAKFPLHLKDEYCRCKADIVCELLDQTAYEFQNVHLSNDAGNVNLILKSGVKYGQKINKNSELIFKHDCASHLGSMKPESEGFTDNCYLLHQNAHDGDTCSSLHLDDNFEGHEQCHLLPDHASSDTRGCSKAVQKLETGTSLKIYKFNTYAAQYSATVNKHDSVEHEYKESASFAELIDSLKEQAKSDFTEESCLCSQAPLISHRKKELALLNVL